MFAREVFGERTDGTMTSMIVYRILDEEQPDGRLVLDIDEYETAGWKRILEDDQRGHNVH